MSDTTATKADIAEELKELKDTIEDMLGRPDVYAVLKSEYPNMLANIEMLIGAEPKPDEFWKFGHAYTGHTCCRKCGHAHWMHGPCIRCNYPADGAACSLCGLTVAESLAKNVNADEEKFRMALADAVATDVIKENAEAEIHVLTECLKD